MYNPELHTRFGGKTGFYSNTYLRFHRQLPYSYTLLSCYCLPITICGKLITPQRVHLWNICHCFLETLLSGKCNTLHMSLLKKDKPTTQKVYSLGNKQIKIHISAK